jgi:hypothetical protein
MHILLFNLIDFWVLLTKDLEDKEKEQSEESKLSGDQQQKVASDDDPLMGQEVKEILNSFGYSFTIYKKLVFLATSGNSIRYFINRLLLLERFGKLPNSILKCLKTTIIDKLKFEDDATYEEFREALEGSLKASNNLKTASRELILREQALLHTYGRVGTFKESQELTENENIFAALKTLNNLSHIMKLTITYILMDHEKFTNSTLTIYRLAKKVLMEKFELLSNELLRLDKEDPIY